MSRMSHRGRRWLSVIVFATAMLAWAAVIPRLRVTTSMTHFLPDAEDKRVATLARSLADSSITSTLTLDVSGAPPTELAAMARTLREKLAADARTRWARSGLDESAFEHTIALFSGRETAALVPAEEMDAAHLRARIASLKAALGTPMGPLVRALAPRDPLGGMVGALDALRSAQGRPMTSQDGALLSEDETHAFVFVATRARAFDAPAQREYLTFVDRTFASVRGDRANARLEIGGVARYAVASEAQIRGDIERIGTLSTLGILLLFALVFRSGRMLGLGLVPLLFGSAVAMVASHLVFGEIHGLTIAFGTSLLGVGIDYAEHYFTHFSLEPEAGAEPIMQRVWPGLWLGAVTTLIGFAGLAFTGFPGVREIAFFSAASIVGALVGTKLLLPPWMPTHYRAPRLPARLATWAERMLHALGRQRALAWAPLLAFAVSLALLARVKFVDDLSVLLSVDPALRAEDTRVRERVTAATPGQFVLVVDRDEERALEKLDATTRALQTAAREGLVGSFAPLGAWIRSPRAQAASFAAARAHRADIARSLDEAGFEAAPFAPFFATLDAPPPAPVRLQDLLATPAGAMLAALAPELPEGRAFVMPLASVRDANELRARLPDAVLIDEPALLESTYRRVRRETVRMLGVGLAFVALTLFARYRSGRLALAAFAPALMAATCTVAIFATLGTALTLLHVVALLLVLSMGADFGIFVVEARASLEETARTLVSIFTATTTTLLSFGLLALSANPALRALGITTTLGLTLSFLFCPATWVLMRLGKART